MTDDHGREGEVDVNVDGVSHTSISIFIYEIIIWKRIGKEGTR